MCSSNRPTILLREAVLALSRIDPSELTVDTVQDLLTTLLPLCGRLDGIATRLVGELEHASGGQVADRDGHLGPVSAVVRELSGTSAADAGRRVAVATALRQLPLVSEAVVDGRLGPQQAAHLSRLVGHIPADDLAFSEAGVLDTAAGLDPVATARLVRHWLASSCEPVLDAEDRCASSRRRLHLRHEPDGTVRGSFLLAAGDAEPVLTVLEALARRQGDADVRSAPQRRADALVDICDTALRTGDLPTSGGQPCQVSIVVPVDWYAQHGTPRFPSLTCATAGFTGPLVRHRVETALCDSRKARVVLDHRGEVASLESLNGEITRTQRRAVAARDSTCTARGCTRPAAFCDVHHLVHREHGGATTLDNLASLCRRHHVQWHQGRLARHDLRLPRDGCPPPADT